ncbi:P-loop containing nucleoside triphosphate hydrolase protein [Ochromonadaceae sp. CCMP2298]|nr:P-loop containing nucleoside triphosphate hydrolase protein [Ochromonadaceae sp. CCMP2298]
MGSTTGAAGLKGRLATSIYNDLSNSQEDTSGQTDHVDVGVGAEVDVDVDEDAEPEEKYPKVELSLDNGFTKLGLYTEIARSLAAQQITEPTPVQRAVIPRALNGENMVMAAATGSGKTLAFMLPAIQSLTQQEADGYTRRPRRPRCLVLVPTRELARQVLQSAKQVSHYSKISSTAVLGGEQYGTQKKNLDRLVDVVVASPGRLMQHKLQGNVYFSQVTHVIIDEVDTMLTQGFGSDIRAILRSVIARPPPPPLLEGEVRKIEDKPAQLVMATATLTKAVRVLLEDVEGGFNIEYNDPDNKTPRQTKSDDVRVRVSVVEVDGVHRSLPNVQHVMEEIKGVDKLVALRNVLSRHHKKDMRTLIFCNTVASCRAVEFAINQDSTVGGSFAGVGGEQIRAVSYHGDLNSAEREANLKRFRAGDEQYLVCSDIAARGLDIPEITHVVLFDFPMNPIDYIHRAGRCGRAGRVGLVTSLVAKRDQVLAGAIQTAIGKGLPIDSLTADKKDYAAKGKLVKVCTMYHIYTTYIVFHSRYTHIYTHIYV